MKQYNIGIIGFGMSGRVFHAPLIATTKGFTIKKIRETKEAHMKIAREKYPDTQIVESSNEIINDPEIDVVVIGAPNRYHYDLAKETLENDKHVVVEKPFTINTPEADELIKLAEEKNKVLTVYHNRRLDSDFKTVKKIIDSGMLGELVEYESHFDRFRNFIKPNTWKEENTSGSGILYDLGAHLIDQALQLFGKPMRITADIRIQRPEGQIPDNFELLMDYGGLKVTLKSSMLVKELLPRFILSGTNGSYIKYGMDVQEAALQQGDVPFEGKQWGLEPEGIWGTINTTYNDVSWRGRVESEKGSYPDFYKNLYMALQGEEEISIKPEQARDVIRIIELAIESNTQKRTIQYS